MIRNKKREEGEVHAVIFVAILLGMYFVGMFYTLFCNYEKPQNEVVDLESAKDTSSFKKPLTKIAGTKGN